MGQKLDSLKADVVSELAVISQVGKGVQLRGWIPIWAYAKCFHYQE